MTISFWFKTNAAAGSVINATMRNRANSANYSVTFTINASGTWQRCSATIPAPPVDSVWNTSNGQGIELFIGSQSTGTPSTANIWSPINTTFTATSTNILGTTGNYVEFTGVQLEKGTIATPFEFRPFAVELHLCQRYFHSSYEIGTAPGSINALTGRLGTYATTASAMLTAFFPVTMRTVPSIIGYNAISGAEGYANIGGGHLPVPVAVSIQACSKSVNLFVDNVGSTNNYYYFHYAATAEF